MDKGKKGKSKSVTINKTPLASKLGGKNYYIVNKFCVRFIDSNHNSNVFYNEEIAERDSYQKWVFTTTDTPGVYNLKSLKTELYLASNEIGDVNTNFIDQESSYQKWSVMSSSEPECYVISNVGNNFVLSSNKMDLLVMTLMEEQFFAEAQNNIMFKIFQFKSKK